MELKKQKSKQMHQRYDVLIAIGMLSAAISILLHKPILFAGIGLLVTYIVLVLLYEKYYGNYLYLEIEKDKLFLFPEDDDIIAITFYNKGKFTLKNGYFFFTIDEEVQVEDGKYQLDERGLTHKVPLTLPANSKITLHLSIKGNKRGITQLANMRYVFFNPFSFTTITLQAQGYWRQEIVVFPNQTPITRMDRLFTNQTGNIALPFALMHDEMDIAGTREHHFSDAMQHIHWKTSAKNQQLHTKVFEHNTDMRWTVLVNASTSSKLNNLYLSKQIDTYLSIISSISMQAIRQDIQIGVWFNLGKPVQLKTNHGTGQHHLKRLLHLFASIDHSYSIVQMNTILHQINQQIDEHHVILYIGELNQIVRHYLSTWEVRNKKEIYVLSNEDNHFVLRNHAEVSSNE
ncbi:DUF58 domain-containing protein [Paraliobacillus ryukyuensis]|uniref:DUF58 domain-containing protein n=1 Tax=Paraliobacillus ryukyuensis TaxID=200904 RepID=UPI0009A7F4B1|nr:DUF58 domain-containing protein [Paraliobacillus ryukyuensis]